MGSTTIRFTTKGQHPKVMASEEHKALSTFIKDVHSSLRNLSSKLGPEQAWEEHCKKRDVLKTYAKTMEQLATTHWDTNNSITSRITWIADFCHQYFVQNSNLESRKKEQTVALKLNAILADENYSYPVKLLDVGSCYNPFKIYDFLDVIAIDISPANNSVLECDFLNIEVKESFKIDTNKVYDLPKEHFEAVTFCFVLEYIPSSDLRLKACQNAYKLLKPGGLLLINTPDSKHVGANAKIMKRWQYSLAIIGFIRIKYEKFRHMHCMAFRKAVLKENALRWAELHKQPYMDGSLPIPQDFNQSETRSDDTITNVFNLESYPDDFKEMPFCILEED